MIYNAASPACLISRCRGSGSGFIDSGALVRVECALKLVEQLHQVFGVLLNFKQVVGCVMIEGVHVSHLEKLGVPQYALGNAVYFQDEFICMTRSQLWPTVQLRLLVWSLFIDLLVSGSSVHGDISHRIFSFQVSAPSSLVCRNHKPGKQKLYSEKCANCMKRTPAMELTGVARGKIVLFQYLAGMVWGWKIPCPEAVMVARVLQHLLHATAAGGGLIGIKWC